MAKAAIIAYIFSNALSRAHRVAASCVSWRRTPRHHRAGILSCRHQHITRARIEMISAISRVTTAIRRRVSMAAGGGIARHHKRGGDIDNNGRIKRGIKSSKSAA